MKKIILSLALSLFICFTGFSAEKIKVACVGDSITFGAKIKDLADRYPQQLDVILGDTYKVENFGCSGATLLSKGNKPYIKTKEYSKALAFKADIVVIKLGTNDSKLENWKKSKNFEADFNALIDSFLKQNPKAEIYLCTPCPAFLVGDKINEDRIAGEVIPLVKKIAKERNLAIIDLHEVFSGKDEMFPDKIHPNEDGAKLIALSVKEAILRDKTSE